MAVVVMVGRTEADILEIEDAGLVTIPCKKDLIQKD